MIKEFPIALSQNIFAEIITFTCQSYFSAALFARVKTWHRKSRPQAHLFVGWARPIGISVVVTICGQLPKLHATFHRLYSIILDCIPLGCVRLYIAVRCLLSLRKWCRPGGFIWKPRRRSLIEDENCKLSSSFLDGSGATHFIQSSRMKSAFSVITAVLAVSALTSANRSSAVWTITTKDCSDLI